MQGFLLHSYFRDSAKIAKLAMIKNNRKHFLGHAKETNLSFAGKIIEKTWTCESLSDDAYSQMLEANENNRKYREFETERNQEERKFNDKVGKRLRSLFAEKVRMLCSAKGCYTE